MRTTILLSCLGLVTACSAITNPGQYHPRDGAVPFDGGPVPDGGDGGSPLPDAGDGGPGECVPGCGAGETCLAGECRCGDGPACVTGSGCCDGACRPLDTTSNCLACGTVCEAGQHQSATCDGTAGCVFSCDPNFRDCNGGTDGCEQDLLSGEHCGDCNTACNAATEVCADVGGVIQCTSSCSGSDEPCNGACVNTSTNVSHCGMCNMACPDLPNSSPTCTAGSCGVVCEGSFGECDGNPTNGCEPFVAYYPDNDNDGFGLGSASTFNCPGRTMPGRSERVGDCDDSNPQVFPGATERCNGQDDNCVGGADETFPLLGSACSCTPTSASGVTVCDPGTGGTRCMYPAEICNGADDDCDSRADQTFTCAASSTQTCTVAGCGSGFQTCRPDCSGYGACTIPETCDRTDNNCDGFVDELALSAGATSFITASAHDPRGDWSGARREVGVVYGTSSGSRETVWFVRLGPTGGALSTPVMVVDQATSWDIAFDGAHWTVAVSAVVAPSTQLEVRTFRVEAGTDRVFPGATIAPVNASHNIATVRVSRAAGSDVAATWWELSSSGPGRARASRFSAPAAAGTPAAPLGSVFEMGPTPGETYLDTAIGNISGGAVAYWVRWRFGSTPPVQDIVQVTVSAAGFGGITTVVSDGDAKDSLDAVNIFAVATTGLVYRRTDGGGAITWPLLALTPSGGRMWEVMAGGGSVIRASIAYSGDSNFGVATTDGTSSTLTRYRATDGVVVRDPVVYSGQTLSLTGVIAGAPGRFVGLSSVGDLTAAPVDCR